jgi:cell division septal protein FtsQ
MSKSKISLTLKKKRNITLIKKCGAIFIFILFFISLLILFLTIDKIKINNIVIVGNSSVSTEDVVNIIQKELDEKYLWIIPTDNIFLLQRFEIPIEILENIKKINTVKISLQGLNTLKVVVSERVSESLWCLGVPEDSNGCYFMDSDGFVFNKAPELTNNIFIKYYGVILKNNPIGENYFSFNKFKDIKCFISEIKKIGFKPESFSVINESQYEIVLSEKSKIIFDNKEDILKNISKLNTLIQNNYIKIDDEFLSKINHIDLRYGSKVHYDFK